VLLCKEGEGPSCLTAPQVAAAKQIDELAKGRPMEKILRKV
jgi:hypothetical protein